MENSLSVCKFISHCYLNICSAQSHELISFYTPYSSFPPCDLVCLRIIEYFKTGIDIQINIYINKSI